jgi:uncharacterized protein YjbJ (UPF0337 family)
MNCNLYKQEWKQVQGKAKEKWERIRNNRKQVDAGTDEGTRATLGTAISEQTALDVHGNGEFTLANANRTTMDVM